MSVLSLIWVVFQVFLSMILYVSTAQAYNCRTVTPITSVTIPDIAIPRDTVVGTKIGSIVSAGDISSYECSNQTPKITYQQIGGKGLGTKTTKISGRNVYLLGDSGLGYTVGLQNRSACGYSDSYYVSGAGTGGGDENTRIICSANGMFKAQPMKIFIFLQLYKVGPIKPGAYSGQNVAAAVVFVNQSTWLDSPESTVRSNAFTLKSQGCSVTNTKITVSMGSIKGSGFKGVGSTVGDQDFNIPLSCDAGVKVGITVTGGSAGNWKADSGLINLDSSSSSTVASGVKLQILSKGSPITLGELINVRTNTVQGAINIPLTARYYQSDSTIRAGVANATATFTMKYE